MTRISRRRLAALAAVVATGALVAATPPGETLAAFVDREFANGVFGVQPWNVQGSTDRTDTNAGTWNDHFSAPATLTVTPTTITPITKAYAPFSLRVAKGSGQAASVTMRTGVATADPSGVAGKFQARIVHSPTGVCNASVFTAGASYLLGSATSYPSPVSPPSAPTFQLAAPTTGADGAPSTLCVEFGVPNDSTVNGKTITVQWTFDATAV